MRKLKWFLYMVVLTSLAPIILFFAGFQSFIIRIEYELKFLKAEYAYQFQKMCKKVEEF